jgi:hypothetical protein
MDEKNIFLENGTQNKARIAVLISHKADFKTKLVRRTKKVSSY